MDAVRPKRSSDDAPSSRRQELEDTLAALRDQETVLTRAIELVEASVTAENKGQKVQPGQSGVVGARPTAEPKDYENRQRQVREDQKRRQKLLWGEIRRFVKNLNKKKYQVMFGQPVRTSAWGQIEANWQKYKAQVEHPMDLGTIISSLGEDDSRRSYKDPTETHAHLRLVSENAIKFQALAEIVEAARELAKTVESKWAENGFDQKWAIEQAREKVEAQVRVAQPAMACAAAQPVLGSISGRAQAGAQQRTNSCCARRLSANRSHVTSPTLLQPAWHSLIMRLRARARFHAPRHAGAGGPEAGGVRHDRG
jgi:Bromodomain